MCESVEPPAKRCRGQATSAAWDPTWQRNRWVAHLDYELPMWPAHVQAQTNSRPVVMAAYTAQDDVTQDTHEHRSGEHNYAGYSERICDRNLMILLSHMLEEARAKHWHTLVFAFLRGTSAAAQLHRFRRMLQAALEFLALRERQEGVDVADLVEFSPKDLQHITGAWVKKEGIDENPVLLCRGVIGRSYNIKFACYGGYTNLLQVPGTVSSVPVDAALFYGVAAAVPPQTPPSTLTLPLSDGYFYWHCASNGSKALLAEAVKTDWHNHIESSLSVWLHSLSAMEWKLVNDRVCHHTDQDDQDGFTFDDQEINFRAAVTTRTVIKRPPMGKERWQGEDIKAKVFIFNHDDYLQVQAEIDSMQSSL